MPTRVDVDRALVRGEAERAIADRFGLTQATVHRHRAHVAQALAPRPGGPPPSRAEVIRVLDLRHEFLWCLEEAKRIGAKGEKAKDLRVALRAIREVRGLLALLDGYGELAQGADTLTRGTSDPAGLFTRFASAKQALAWLESDGLPMLRAAASAEEHDDG